MNKILATMAALIMIAAIFVPAVTADTQQVTTSATVSSGAGGTPVVLAKFELNDDIPDNDVSDPINVIPGPENSNPGRTVNIYTAVSNTNGAGYQAGSITRVDIKIFYPQVLPNHAGVGLQAHRSTDAQNGGGVLEISSNAAEILAAVTSAVAQGVLTQAQADAIVLHTANGEWRFFKTSTTLKYFDVAGLYNVFVVANNNAGARSADSDSSTLPRGNPNTFDYISIKSLGIDFASIDYGLLAPSSVATLSGDDIFGNTQGARTIRNLGNDPFKLKIKASDLLHAGDSQNKILGTDVDSTVYGEASYAVVPNGFVALGASGSQNQMLSNAGVPFDPIISPDTWKPSTPIINPNAPFALQGIQVETGTHPIDWSLHVPAIFAQDYSGTVTLETFI